MTVESAIFTALKPLAPTFPLTAPQGTLPPYLTYQRIAGREWETLANGGGAPRVRMQIDVWSGNFTEAATLAAEVKVALRVAVTVGEITDNPDQFEPDTRLYRASFDAAIWA